MRSLQVGFRVMKHPRDERRWQTYILYAFLLWFLIKVCRILEGIKAQTLILLHIGWHRARKDENTLVYPESVNSFSSEPLTSGKLLEKARFRADIGDAAIVINRRVGTHSLEYTTYQTDSPIMIRYISKTGRYLWFIFRFLISNQILFLASERLINKFRVMLFIYFKYVVFYLRAFIFRIVSKALQPNMTDKFFLIPCTWNFCTNIKNIIFLSRYKTVTLPRSSR